MATVQECLANAIKAIDEEKQAHDEAEEQQRLHACSIEMEDEFEAQPFVLTPELLLQHLVNSGLCITVQS